MNYITITGIILFILLLGILYLLIKLSRKKKIKACDIHDFDCVRKNINAKKNISEKEKIIDYDKLYHKILLKAGYRGRFGNILKKNPSEITNINKIWELHKVRNHLVHEIGSPEGISLFQVANDYNKEVSALLKRFKK